MYEASRLAEAQRLPQVADHVDAEPEARGDTSHIGGGGKQLGEHLAASVLPRPADQPPSVTAVQVGELALKIRAREIRGVEVAVDPRTPAALGRLAHPRHELVGCRCGKRIAEVAAILGRV